MRARAMSMLVSGIAAMIVGCGGGESEAEREARLASMTPQEREIQAVIELRCIKCHEGKKPEGKIPIMKPHDLLPLIDSEKLYDDLALYRMLMGPEKIAEHARTEYQLQQSEIDLIRNWVLTEHREKAPADTAGADTASTAAR